MVCRQYTLGAAPGGFEAVVPVPAAHIQDIAAVRDLSSKVDVGLDFQVTQLAHAFAAHAVAEIDLMMPLKCVNFAWSAAPSLGAERRVIVLSSDIGVSSCNFSSMKLPIV